MWREARPALVGLHAHIPVFREANKIIAAAARHCQPGWLAHRPPKSHKSKQSPPCKTSEIRGPPITPIFQNKPDRSFRECFGPPARASARRARSAPGHGLRFQRVPRPFRDLEAYFLGGIGMSFAVNPEWENPSKTWNTRRGISGPRSCEADA